MSTTVTYKNETLATVSNNTKTLKTAGKYMEDDVVLTDVSASSPTVQSLSIIPSESAQTFNASGVDGYKPVSVSAISSTYVGSGITQRDSDDLTASGATVSVPAGYYNAVATYRMPSKDLGSGNITLSLDSTTGVVSAYVSISSAQAGYYGAQTTGNKTLQLTLRDSDDLTTSGATISVPAGYYSTAASKSVASGSATAPASISGTAASISTGTNTITLTKTVSVTPTVSAGYVSSGTAGNSSVSLTASVTVNPTPTASGATVTIPAGYYSSQTTKSVTSGSATGPSSLSGSSATVSTGTNTLTLTKTGVTTTPTVSAGYVSSATASTATVTLTASVTTKAAATITPTTTNQTIAAGTYLTGTQTIAGDADLIASNIVSGVQIFGVTGNVVLQHYYTGSSAPSSSLGQNGDIYLQQTGA